MSDFDQKLQELLGAEERDLLDSNFEEEGYYTEVMSSFRGKGRWIRIGCWFGVFVCCSVLFYAAWMFFQVQSTKDQIMCAAIAIMMNSAQISLKLWLHQRMNRRAVLIEIQRLRVELAARESVCDG